MYLHTPTTCLIFVLCFRDKKVIPANEASTETIHVLATCHSLVLMDEGVVGDPLEKAVIHAVGWKVQKGNNQSSPCDRGGWEAAVLWGVLKFVPPLIMEGLETTPTKFFSTPHSKNFRGARYA